MVGRESGRDFAVRAEPERRNPARRPERPLAAARQGARRTRLEPRAGCPSPIQRTLTPDPAQPEEVASSASWNASAGVR